MNFNRGQLIKIFSCCTLYFLALLPIFFSKAHSTEDQNITDAHYHTSLSFRPLIEQFGYTEAYQLYLSTPKKKPVPPFHPFTKLPPFETLKNHIGYELSLWRLESQKQRSLYKKAHKKLTQKEEQKNKKQEKLDEEERKITSANTEIQLTEAHPHTRALKESRSATQAYDEENQRFEMVRKEYQAQHPSLTAQELEKLAYAARINLRLPYQKHPDQLIGRDRVKGFALETSTELKIATFTLKNLVESLERENQIFDDIYLCYQQKFLIQFAGWGIREWKNWSRLNDILKRTKDTLRGMINNNYPSVILTKYARDETTPQGKALAQLHKDQRGQFLRKIYFKIVLAPNLERPRRGSKDENIWPDSPSDTEINSSKEWHSVKWKEVCDELKKRHPETEEVDTKQKKITLKDHAPDITPHSYQALYERYQTALERNRKLLIDLHEKQSSYSYIPIPFELFFVETNVNPLPNTSLQSTTIDLSSLNISTQDLDKIRKKEELLKGCTEVNLSNNKLANPPADIFCDTITHLSMGNDFLVNSAFVKNLPHLISLDVSNNCLNTLSEAFSNLTLLEHLDLSKNDLTDIQALMPLANLKHLNLSENKIRTLVALNNHTKLQFLNISKNKVEGTWLEVLPYGLDSLLTLDVSGNHKLGINRTITEVKIRYPALQTYQFEEKKNKEFSLF